MTTPEQEPTPAQPPVQYVYVQAPAPRKTNAYAVGSLVLGILSVLGGWCCFGIPGFAALFFGYLGYRETKDGQEAGEGMAIAGMLLGAFTAIGWAILGLLGVVGGLADAVTG